MRVTPRVAPGEIYSIHSIETNLKLILNEKVPPELVIKPEHDQSNGNIKAKLDLSMHRIMDSYQ